MEGLISEPYFIRKHLSCINPKLTTSYSLLIREEVFRTAECKEVLKCLSHDRPLYTRTLNFPVIDPLLEVANIRIVGSCNGLICVQLLDPFFSFVLWSLWNPCTGESQVLPRPPHPPSLDHFVGFGYDSTTDDYKLLLGSDQSGHEFVSVFSLKMGSWRQLERLKFNRYFRITFAGRLVHEALHWVLDRVLEEEEYGSLMASKIVSFDLAGEKFHETPFPFPPNPVERLSLYDCLTLFQTNNGLPGGNFKMWVLKEYGVKESWTEVISIPQEVFEDDCICSGCISENGEVLMELSDDPSLALYNPVEKKFRKTYGLWWLRV